MRSAHSMTKVAVPSADTTAGLVSTPAVDPTWKPLYLIGSAAALITAVLIPIAAIVFIVWPPPSTVIDYFTLFQNNWLLGLLDLDLVMIVAQVLLVPILLALYVALRRESESFMAIGTTLGLVAAVLYFASREATFTMLFLSRQYAAATTNTERSLFLAAGQTVLAIYNGTAFHLSYNIGQVAGIIISAVMLRNTIFSKAAAYAGILGNAIGFGLYVPTIGIYISLFSVVGLWIWYILIGRRLFQLGQAISKEAANPN
jgi:uncharacterized protein DUF4386